MSTADAHHSPRLGVLFLAVLAVGIVAALEERKAPIRAAWRRSSRRPPGRRALPMTWLAAWLGVSVVTGPLIGKILKHRLTRRGGMPHDPPDDRRRVPRRAG